MKNKLLVIFDMDGLMFDTERLALQAWKAAAEYYNFQIDVETMVKNFTGKTEVDILKGMRELFGNEAPVKEWRSYIQKKKIEIVDTNQTVYKKKGLVSLLNFLMEKEIKIAVASSNHLKTIEKYLRIENIREYIDVVISGDEVKYGKPNPEIFLKACQKLNIFPSQSLVLEDSFAGVQAAKNALMDVFFIPDLTCPNEAIQKSATRIFNDLEEVKEYLSQYY